MSFLLMVAGLSFRNRMGRSKTQSQLSTPPYGEEPADLVRMSPGHLPRDGVSEMSNWEETQRLTEDTLDRLYLEELKETLRLNCSSTEPKGR